MSRPPSARLAAGTFPTSVGKLAIYGLGDPTKADNRDVLDPSSPQDELFPTAAEGALLRPILESVVPGFHNEGWFLGCLIWTPYLWNPLYGMVFQTSRGSGEQKAELKLPTCLCTVFTSASVVHLSSLCLTMLDTVQACKT